VKTVQQAAGGDVKGQPLIFAVDDDPLVLASLGKLIEIETPYAVRTFSSGPAALEAMSAAPPDVIVSDLAMPGMDGIELLGRARALAPDAARIILTGFADKDSAIRSINEAGIYQFIEKPWDNAQLLQTIGNAVEHVSLSRRLIAAERLAAVGRLATGIAHEIGNQLSLLGFAELLAERFAGNPEVTELTDPLLAAKRRLSSMVASIKEFVRGAGAPSYGREVLPLTPIVDEMLSILRFEPALKLRRIEKRPFDREARASVNHEKLLQVVLNLVRNAIQATREGGKIRIGVARRGDLAVIEVEDDGVGIAPELHERIFEPFFSTKGDQGTGLGLGICRRIVEEHGGRIRLASESGQGARFSVELPLARSPDCESSG
jgi:signal transduction histidine kinase